MRHRARGTVLFSRNPRAAVTLYTPHSALVQVNIKLTAYWIKGERLHAAIPCEMLLADSPR